MEEGPVGIWGTPPILTACIPTPWTRVSETMAFQEGDRPPHWHTRATPPQGGLRRGASANPAEGFIAAGTF
jgi:hypothetical protein